MISHSHSDICCIKWFEYLGDPVPTAQHWLILPSRQVDFNANSVWAYVQKLKGYNNKVCLCLCVFYEDMRFLKF